MGNDNSVIDDFEDTDFKIRTITPQDEAEFLRDRNDKKHQVIELNIGGKHYTTLLSTLEKAKPKKPLTSLFTHKDKDGRYFLDRDWEPFEIIIEALRTGDPLELPSDPEARNKLISEVKFFGMEEYFKNDLEVGKFIGGTLLSAADKKQIHQWVGNPNHNWKLIFKATRDGFSNFRNKCTLQGETITVIQTTGGYLFGGYAPIDWTKNIGYSYDHRTFLFTLKVPGGQRIKIPNNGPYAGHAYSIYNHTSYGPTFGGGFDLYICGTNKKNASFSNLGHSFSVPGISYSSTAAKNFLAGSYYFNVSEIEVYSKM